MHGALTQPRSSPTPCSSADLGEFLVERRPLLLDALVLELAQLPFRDVELLADLLHGIGNREVALILDGDQGAEDVFLLTNRQALATHGAHSWRNKVFGRAGR